MGSANEWNSRRIGFFGGGMMAAAIISGLLEGEKIVDENILVCEPVEKRRKELEKELGIKCTDNPIEMLRQSDIVFIAVKPDIVRIILKDIAKHEDNNTEGGDRQVFISICAGVTLETLMDGRGKRKVARVMPNQPCVVSEAASAYALNESCAKEDGEAVEYLMGSCGTIVRVSEKNLDGVTGVSGSGPGFVFMMIESMIDGGVRNGLSRDVARELAAQTVLGSAKMVLSMPTTHVAELRNRVESPGGTTIMGTGVLERGGFRSTVIDAVTAAVERAAELGKK